MLTPRQYRFVVEYCKEDNGTKAAICAGYAESSAHVVASNLLKNYEIVAAIESHRKDLAAAAGLTPAKVTNIILKVADAGRVCNCRYCWGIDHGYHWTEREYGRKLANALKIGEPAPDYAGGFGFIKRREPNEDCPHCKGEGVMHEPAAKPGDLLKAADLLQKQLGMQVERRELSGPGGGPILIDPMIPAREIPADILDSMALEIMTKRGMIEGTLSAPDDNGIRISQLVADVSP